MTASCSIVLSSYNKADYVGIAVESALAQTLPGVEVIVVDDGSRDNSVDVLKTFGDRIKLAVQPNSGQAVAMNNGFLLSTGEVVLFFDGDDVLYPDTAERIVSMWTPNLSKVHYRLRRIDEAGAEIDGPPLPPYRPMPEGDLSELIYRFGFYPSPPTSGNAFARRYLEKVLPVPGGFYPSWADTYLIGCAPLFGDIGVLPGYGAAWRHSVTNISRGGLPTLRAKVKTDHLYLECIRRFAAELGSTRPVPGLWPQHLKERLILAKFDRQPDETLNRILRQFLQTVWAWPEYPVAIRMKFTAWALGFAAAPGGVLRAIPGVLGPNFKLA